MARTLFDGREEDMHPDVLKAFEDAGTGMTIPRIVRANVVQILTIVESLLRALRTGRMRWALAEKDSLRPGRPARFLIEKGRAPEAGESFEGFSGRPSPYAAAEAAETPQDRLRGAEQAGVQSLLSGLDKKRSGDGVKPSRGAVPDLISVFPSP